MVATHPGQVIGWLADTPCKQSGAVSGLKPQSINIACVASVSVGFGSKERPRNRIFGVLSARKMG